MHTLLRSFFRVEFADPDLQRRALTTMRLSLVLAVLAAFFIVVVMMSTRSVNSVFTILFGITLFAGSAWLARQGRPTVASWLIIATFLVTILGSLIFNTTNGPITSGFYLVATVVIAGITMRPVQVWLVAAVDVVALAVVIATNHMDALQSPSSSLLVYSSAGLIVLVAGISFIGAHVLQRTLQDVLLARGAADQAQQALAVANSSLEEKVAAQTAELQRSLAEQQALAADLHQSLSAQQQLNQTINDLALPIIPINDTTLILPLTGVLDSDRANILIQTVLQHIGAHRTRTIILDVTGVPLIDTQVAGALLRTAEAAHLMGANTILVGIRPEVAQALVSLGVELHGLTAAATLQAALASSTPQRNLALA